MKIGPASFPSTLYASAIVSLGAALIAFTKYAGLKTDGKYHSDSLSILNETKPKLKTPVCIAVKSPGQNPFQTSHGLNSTVIH